MLFLHVKALCLAVSKVVKSLMESAQNALCRWKGFLFQSNQFDLLVLKFKFQQHIYIIFPYVFESS